MRTVGVDDLRSHRIPKFLGGHSGRGWCKPVFDMVRLLVEGNTRRVARERIDGFRKGERRVVSRDRGAKGNIEVV